MKPLYTHDAPADEGGRTPEKSARQALRQPVGRIIMTGHDEAPRWTFTSEMIDSLCREHIGIREPKVRERPCGSSADRLDVLKAYLGGSTAG